MTIPRTAGAGKPALHPAEPGSAGGRSDPDPGGPTAALSSADLAGLFRSEQARLCRVVRRRVGDADEAADLVQDAFARLIEARPMLLRAPAAYLQRIVGNLLRDRAKRAENRFLVRDVCLGDIHEPAVPPEQGWAIEADDLKARFTAAVAGLSPRTREVFLLHRVEELRYREIAQRLDITVATVEYHMTRALVQLDELLDR